MGVFDCYCAESGLVIDDEQQLIVIVEAAKGSWRPVALPIEGSNNRYGTMDVPSKLDANMKAVRDYGRTLLYEDEAIVAKKIDFEAMLDEIRADGSGARAGKQHMSFALIEQGVYAAIVETVTENGPAAWTHYARLGLDGKPDARTRRLCEAIVAAPHDDATRKVYVDHLLEREDPRGRLLSLLPAIGKVGSEVLAELVLVGNVYAGAPPNRAQLVDFVRFCAWGTRLVPAQGGGQYSGYDGDYGVHTYVDQARKKYAGMPQLLEAVKANERAWRERGD